MALDDDKNKLQDEEQSGGSGTQDGTAGGTAGGASGQSGQVEFRDFLSSGARQRDDLLSSQEQKRLIFIHESTHAENVKKQKATREERRALKTGKVSLQSYYNRLNGSATNKYKVNPVLANKAQFSGVDRQVSALPHENIAETNQDKREKLEFQYNLRHRPQVARKVEPPKLKPY